MNAIQNHIYSERIIFKVLEISRNHYHLARSDTLILISVYLWFDSTGPDLLAPRLAQAGSATSQLSDKEMTATARFDLYDHQELAIIPRITTFGGHNVAEAKNQKSSIIDDGQTPMLKTYLIKR